MVVAPTTTYHYYYYYYYCAVLVVGGISQFAGALNNATPSEMPTRSATTHSPSLMPSYDNYYYGGGGVPTTRPTPPEPTQAPSHKPTTPEPSLAPVPRPTASPSHEPTSSPVPRPTASPTTRKPTTARPSGRPSESPTTLAPSARPSLSPTTSAVPSAMPSISAMPSSAPTVEPRLTMLPLNVTLVANKPNSATETIYLINLSDRELTQCLVRNTRQQTTATPEYSISLDGGDVVASKNAESVPFVISTRVGENSQQARLRVETSGLTRNAYELEFLAIDAEGETACSNNVSDASRNSVQVRVIVDATADAARTTVSQREGSVAILGEEFDGIEILARDAEGDVVTWQALESFDVELGFDGGLEASCVPQAANESTGVYRVLCTIPNVLDAGRWSLDVRVNNELVGDNLVSFVDVVCPEGSYRDPRDQRCSDCEDLDGAICDVAGLTLETIGIEKGKWRASSTSRHIYECDYDDSCDSSDKIPDASVAGGFRYKAWANHLCRDGFMRGPLCQVCKRYSRYDAIKNRCVACSRNSDKLRFSLILVGFFLVVALVFTLVVWLAKKMGASNDLSEFVREAVRYGSGDGTIRVLRRRSRSAYTEAAALERADATSVDVDDDAKRKRALIMQRLKVSMLNKVKILIAFFQILSSMPWVFSNVRFPASFNAISNAMSFFDLHFLRVLSIECVFKAWNFYRILFFSTALPLVLSLAIYLATILRVKWVEDRVVHPDPNDAEEGNDNNNNAPADTRVSRGSQQQQQQQQQPDGGDDGDDDNNQNKQRLSIGAYRQARLQLKRAKAIREVKNQGIFVFLLLTFLIYPSVSTICFQYFSCEKFRGTRGNCRKFLQVDLGISCCSPSYKDIRPYAILSLFAYPLGIPLIYLSLLWRHRHEINPELEDADALQSLQLAPDDQNFLITAGRELGFVKQMLKVHKRDRDESIAHLTFLYEEYEPRAYLFSVFDCLRKLVLTGILVFLYPGSTTQIGFGTLFALVCAKVYSHSRPFIEDEDDLIAEFAMEALTVFFFLSLMLHVSTTCDDEEDQTNKATRVFAGPVFSAVAITMLCTLVFLTAFIVFLEVFGFEALTTSIVNRFSSTNAQKRRILRALSESGASSTQQLSDAFSPTEDDRIHPNPLGRETRPPRSSSFSISSTSSPAAPRYTMATDDDLRVNAEAKIKALDIANAAGDTPPPPPPKRAAKKFDGGGDNLPPGTS